MCPMKSRLLWLLCVLLIVAGPSIAFSAEMPVEEAWKALPTYHYGQDMAVLLAIDRAVIQAMASPQTRSACAARLAAVLDAPATTPAARQYICLQLRQIGTPAEVPALAKLMSSDETAEIARPALEAIPGDASLDVLRKSLTTLKGKSLVGVINSVAKRRDARCVATLQTLATDADKSVAAAALWALGSIANAEAVAYLRTQAEKAGKPIPQSLAVPLLRSAESLAAADKMPQAQAIYETLSQTGQPQGVRRAALTALLGLKKEQRTATILAWIADADADRRLVALNSLPTLTDEQLDQAADRLGDLPENSQRALVEVLAARRGKETLPLVLSLAQSDKPGLKLAGVRCLAMVGDPSVIPLLLDTLAAGGELTKAAEQSLCALPQKEVTAALIDALKTRPAVRAPVIDVLATLKCYEAIDSLIVLAAEDDPATYGPALDGLRRIADPDEHDVPRLIRLLLNVSPGKQGDEVERTILHVCDKQPAGSNRVAPVLAALAKVDQAEAPKYLPLLGRFGGPEARKLIDAGLASADPTTKEAAACALCNWPTAEVADQLLEFATHASSETLCHRALRAYVRVISLKSDRPEAETLTMLQNAMKLAKSSEDQQLIIQRASNVRTMESVLWVAQYLDDPALAQAACVAIADLAHHRFLRHPNLDRFNPILEKVSRISKDPQIVERAKRYRLGL